MLRRRSLVEQQRVAPALRQQLGQLQAEARVLGRGGARGQMKSTHRVLDRRVVRKVVQVRKRHVDLTQQSTRGPAPVQLAQEFGLGRQRRRLAPLADRARYIVVPHLWVVPDEGGNQWPSGIPQRHSEGSSTIYLRITPHIRRLVEQEAVGQLSCLLVDPSHFRNILLNLLLLITTRDGKTMRLLCEVELNHIFVLQYNVAQARDH